MLINSDAVAYQLVDGCLQLHALCVLCVCLLLCVSGLLLLLFQLLCLCVNESYFSELNANQ